MLGQYKIVATGPSLKEEAHFTVSEYLLPKFEVVLLPPAAVVRDAQQTVFKVCNVVSGNIFLTLSKKVINFLSAIGLYL